MECVPVDLPSKNVLQIYIDICNWSLSTYHEFTAGLHSVLTPYSCPNQQGKEAASKGSLGSYIANGGHPIYCKDLEMETRSLFPNKVHTKQTCFV